MTLVLFVTCIQTPLDIAFSSEIPDSILEDPFLFFIDVMFLIDILVIFNTAYYTLEMQIVD